MKTSQIDPMPGSTPLGLKPTTFKYHCTIRLLDYSADTMAELSAIYCRLRDASQEGASTFSPVLVRETGRALPIGHIAYNGRIFAGRPQEWSSATKLLYDNR